jgi:hypothetical protein
MARFKIKHFKVHLRIEIIRHGFANIMLRLFVEIYMLLSESEKPVLLIIELQIS